MGIREFFLDEQRLAWVIEAPDFEVPNRRAQVPLVSALKGAPECPIRTPQNEPEHRSVVSVRLDQRPVRGTWHFCADLAYPSSGIGCPPDDLCVAGEVLALREGVYVHNLDDEVPVVA